MPNFVKNKLSALGGNFQEVIEHVLEEVKEGCDGDYQIRFEKLLMIPRSVLPHENEDYLSSEELMWRKDNWGCKWNPNNVYLVNDVIEFETPWSCPRGWLMALSEKFKEVDFQLEYADEDLGYNCGTITFGNGVVFEESFGDREFACNIWGYDLADFADDED